MDYVLGMDIGTGSVKAVAVDLKGNSFSDNQQHYGFSSPKPGYHEQDPEQIWNAFRDCIHGLTHKTAGQPLAVGLSSAMHSLIAVDANGKALAPMMTWADNRSFEIAKRLKASDEGMAIYRATGTPLHAMSPLCKIIWLRENEPELFDKTHKFISIKDYIWYKLFNEFKTDHSIASGMGLFDIEEHTWYAGALKLAGITGEQLAEPVPTDYTRKINKLKSDLIQAGTPFTITASDGCLANLGSMADKPGIAALTIGTSGAVRVASNKPLPNDKAMTFSYILDKGTFICGGPINNGGIAMQWWLKNFIGASLNEQEYAKVFEQVAAIPAGSDRLIFLPYLTGERAPIWDSESCGNFFGVKLQHGRAHFSRAVLEGICFALKDVLDAVEENSGPVTQINISGGFVKSKVWVQTLADITGKNLCIIQNDDASAVGAAFMAMKANGLITDYPNASIKGQQLFKPNPANIEAYQKNFSIYKQLYVDLNETMHRL
jgi:gluconokinase